MCRLLNLGLQCWAHACPIAGVLYNCYYLGVRRMKKSAEHQRKSNRTRGRAMIGEAQSANVLARADLMAMISDVIGQRGWTQSEAAVFLGVGQPRISDLYQGRVDRFTVDMLMIWLEKLGKDVSISVQNSIFGHEGHEKKVQLALYVCGAADKHLLDNIAALFQGNTDRYSLRIINVLDQPSLAESERITSIPSLVKEMPEPRLVITGDLSAKSVRWQLASAERRALDNRHAAQELRQASQDQRDTQLTDREQRSKTNRNRTR